MTSNPLPNGPLRIVLDTDTYNEIDDQFALVQALLSPDRLALEAVYAAPFHNRRSEGPGDGMEKSYQEICKIFDLLGMDPAGRVFRGSPAFLGDPSTPVDSPATDDLIRRAGENSGTLLYVVAIGAITNIASAILKNPGIIQNIVVVWLGGHAYHWPDTREFNLQQDPLAARFVLQSGVPFVHIPCNGVASHLLVSREEMADRLPQHSRIGKYLAEIFDGYMDHFSLQSKVLWDMSAVAYLLDPAWVPSRLVTCPILKEDLTWGTGKTMHRIRSAYFVERDPILRDFFEKMGVLRRQDLP